MSAIDSLIQEQGFDFTATACSENPTMVDAGQAMDHWRCSLGDGERTVTFYVSYEGSLRGDEAPGASEAIAFAMADIATLGGDPDDDAWLSRVNADGLMGDIRENWLGARRRIETMAAAFGHVIGVERLRALVSMDAEAGPAFTR